MIEFCKNSPPKRLEASQSDGMAQDGQKLPAVKIFISQLDNAVKPLDGVGEGNMVGFILRDVPFARVWLQVGYVTCTTRSPVDGSEESIL